MQTQAFDAIVVGAGQAGPALAARCAKEGLRTAVIERHQFGGTCVNVGCVPTKTLVASARAIHLARRGAEFGFAAARSASTWRGEGAQGRHRAGSRARRSKPGCAA